MAARDGTLTFAPHRDALSPEFTLRQNLRFHNRDPVTTVTAHRFRARA
jgi:hypothetical protein